MTEATSDGAHVRPAMREFLAIDGPERLWACWERIWISTPSTRQAFAALETCMNGPATTKPRGLTIVGESDTGKSRIFKAFQDAHPAVKAPGREYATIPAIYIKTVSTPDPVSFCKDVLAEIGHPLLYNASEPDLRRHTIRMIKGCGVGVVIIDEFNDILNDRMSKKVDEFLRFLKILINSTERPFVVGGTPTVLEVTGSENQIGGRLKKTIRLKAFTRTEFAPVALAFERMLPLRRPSDFRSDETMLVALWEASQGLIGRLSHFLQDACEIAIQTGEERITPDILRKVEAATLGALGNRG